MIPIPNLSFTILGLSVTPFFWSLVLAFVFSSFSFWRRLKEDFKEEEIFTLTLTILFFSLFFSRLFFVLLNINIYGLELANWFSLPHKNNFCVVGAFCGAILACFLGAKKIKKEFWEAIDALSLPIFYIICFSSVGLFLQKGELFLLFYLLVGILGVFLNLHLIKRYRSISWYKSGKIGFLFLVSGIYFFLSLLALAILSKAHLYLEEFFLGLTVILLFVSLYRRSERKIKEDLGGIWPK